MRHFTRLLSLSLLALPAAACNEVENGHNGLVDFAPDNCGQSYCDLDDGLAVGATTEVYLDGTNDDSVSDLHIESSAPWIVDVLDQESGISPRATLGGNDEGYVDLLAVDRFGYVVDWVTIHVVAADELSVDVSANDGAAPDGPHANDLADDLYFAQIGQSIAIDATALASGSPLMGRMDYSVETDAAMAAAIGSQDVGDGRFDLRLPAGEHDLLHATATTWRTIHFSVK
jgi:hypothetical protein